MSRPVYLDYAAATPLDPAVLAAMEPYLKDHFGNPSSDHSFGRYQREALAKAQAKIARTLGAKPTEIVLTSGTTESLNLATQGVAKRFERQSVVVSAVEHEAVLQTVSSVPGVELRLAPVGSDGQVQTDRLASLIDDTTTLICIQHTNNELGVLQPVTAVAELVDEVRRQRQEYNHDLPLYFVCDAAQAGTLNLQVDRLGVDMLAMGGSKLYGPAGTGFLYIRTGTQLEPLFFGGGQQLGVRSGTENVAGAVGLAEALELCQNDRKNEHRRLSELRRQLVDRLTAVEGVRIRTASSQHPGIISLTVEGVSGEDVVAHCDAEGFAVATGAACAASNGKPSTVLLACGLSEAQVKGSLRISLGRPTTQEEVAAFGDRFSDIVGRVRQLSGGSETG
ncbi:cysteine desulfurase [Patescibacteria group bacterium]|nr:MAG: cysteine desulfurase [Patescibacteria group bacterium]